MLEIIGGTMRKNEKNRWLGGFLVLVFLCTVVGAWPICTSAAQDIVPVPILMYHNLTQNGNAVSPWTLEKWRFEEDLAYLRDNGYTTVSLADLLSYVNGTSNLPQKPIMITFDDGYLSNYTYALPLLSQYGMKAVISVVGAYVRSTPYENVTPEMMDTAFLTWEQLREMKASGVFEVGNHTNALHDSPGRKGCLQICGESRESYSDLLGADLLACQKNIQAIGETAMIFSYPSGSYSYLSNKIINHNGYTFAFTSTRGGINYIGRGSYGALTRLKRVNRPGGMGSAEYFKRLNLTQATKKGPRGQRPNLPNLRAF